MSTLTLEQTIFPGDLPYGYRRGARGLWRDPVNGHDPLAVPDAAPCTEWERLLQPGRRMVLAGRQSVDGTVEER